MVYTADSYSDKKVETFKQQLLSNLKGFCEARKGVKGLFHADADVWRKTERAVSCIDGNILREFDLS